jgi:hyaluronan synthase
MDTFFNSLSHYSQFAFFYVPLGIIGIWRWSVWIIRKIISLFYRSPKGTYETSLSIVVPVYNEDPELFQLALYSWEANRPDEIIAVIDYTDTSSIEIFENFAKNFSGAKLIITKKPGKRPALADGTRAASSEIVALVDSDAIWSADIKKELLGAFADPEVGGIVTRQDVLRPNTLARKLFKILLDDRYLLEYPFLATVSDAVLCLSGRTAVYRKIAIIDELDKLENETFWGKKMISGDDKSLTNFVHAKGWKTRYLKNVKVYTSGAPDILSYVKQKLRWTRNGLRSDSRVLLSGWLWKNHKILALHMLDKVVSPITLLLGLSYAIVSFYLGHWQVALIISLWWIITRFIKIFPHLRERPIDIFILPFYIISTFVVALIKVYALVTIDKQGWITRWEAKRLKRSAIWEYFLTSTATFAIIFGLFFLVFGYKNYTLKIAQMKKLHAQELRRQDLKNNKQIPSILTLDMPRPSDTELTKTKNTLLEKNQSDPYGYYIVKIGETLPLLRRRFNLAPTGRILNATTKAPIGAFSPLPAGSQIAIPVADLRNPISLTKLNVFAKPPRITYDAVSNTIFINQGGSVATLTKINQTLSLGNKKLLEQIAPGEWILRANLYIGKDVTLILDKREVSYLKLKSDDDGFIWMRSETGNLLFSQTKITSWDEKNGTPDYIDQDGRAYITAKNTGRMDIIGSELAYLGYVGSPKRGGPFGGSYGVSWKIKSGGLHDRLLTGVVRGSKFHNNYFGVYSFGATGLLFQENEFYDNIEYGLDPHDDSNNMLIENNRAYQNGNHGIILSKRCVDNIIINNTSYNNRLHGIMLDRSSHNNLVQGNTVYGNVDGLAIYESNENIILDNIIKNNVRGARLNAGASHNFLENNKLTDNSRGFYLYGNAQNNILINNPIVGSEIGITLKQGANQNILLDNFKMLDNIKDGRVTTDAHENNIQ